MSKRVLERPRGRDLEQLDADSNERLCDRRLHAAQQARAAEQRGRANHLDQVIGGLRVDELDTREAGEVLRAAGR